MQPRILFFDSGIGGLSIYHEVIARFPQYQYSYCLDNAAFPYSEKTESFIVARVRAICQAIAKIQTLDAIVIACNTASTACLPQLFDDFSLPIIGTFPAIQQAATLSETKRLALIATKGTIQRQAVADLISHFASHCQVEKFGSTLLVEMAENKLQGQQVNLSELEEHLAPLKAITDLDCVMLGCTHFPFLQTELSHVLPQVKHFVHPGKAIAEKVGELLALHSSTTTQAKPLNDELKSLFSTAPLKLEKQQIFSHLGFAKTHVLTLEIDE